MRRVLRGVAEASDLGVSRPSPTPPSWIDSRPVARASANCKSPQKPGRGFSRFRPDPSARPAGRGTSRRSSQGRATTWFLRELTIPCES